MDKAPEKMMEYMNNISSYKASSEMAIYRDDKTIKFNVDVDYLAPDHYKVMFENADNNTQQIIVKNDSGVYALTPALGKEFKFESSWPLNGSHAYLLNTVVDDMKTDEETSVKKDGKNAIITSKITHRTNSNLKYQEVLVDSKFTPISVSFFTEESKEAIKVTFKNFTKGTNLTKSDFDVDKIMKDSVSNLGEGSVSSVEGSLVVSYTVEGCNLISIREDSPVVMKYNGEKAYTIICQDVLIGDVQTVSRIYQEFELTDIGVAFINDNSITVHYQNKEILVISEVLTENEKLDIINSINFA